MAKVKDHTDELSRLKECVENTYQCWRENYDRFHDLRTFVFAKQISDTEEATLNEVKKPQIEVNVLEAFVSRLRGEFAAQEPSIMVSHLDTQANNAQLEEFLEGHIRYYLYEANKNSLEFNCYTDTLSGGFSVIECGIEYAHEMSFDQKIAISKCPDPTLIGFDPLAKLDDKSDGNYCFKVYPKRAEEFKREYPNVDISAINYTRELEGFNWSYNNNNEDILLICEFYEKIKKRVRIVKLADGRVMTASDYKKFLLQWELEGHIEQPPFQIGNGRMTDMITIERKTFIQNKLISCEDTDYDSLPLIFVDGNSVWLRRGANGAVNQMTRPYIYHAYGTQKLKNFAAQTWANELENMVMHKWIIAQQALPDNEDYLEPYMNPQIPSTMVYNAINNANPDQFLPPPQPVVRSPMPPEIAGAFGMTDQTIQMILGSFDAALGINDNQLSGKAIIEGATQSNAAAMPYVVNFLKGLQRLAVIIVQLLPKIQQTPNSLPVILKDGKRSYVKVNQPGGVMLNYDPRGLQVKIEPGVSFAVQKNKALQQLIAMMQASPLFAEFMNTKGLPVLLENLEIRGADTLQELGTEFMQEMEQRKQQMSQMPNPEMIKAQSNQAKIQIDQAKLQNEAQRTKLQQEELLLKAHQIEVDAKIGQQRAIAEMTRARADVAMAAIDKTHDRHRLEIEHDYHIHKKEMDKKNADNKSMKKNKKNDK